MPAVIGTRAHAQLAYDMWLNHTLSADNSPFEILGSGSIRKAILHKATDVVYKVEYTGEEDGWRKGYSNKVEYKNVKRLEKLLYPDRWWSTRVRIPKVSLFNVANGIIAMEHIKGKRGLDCDPSPHYNFMQELRAIGIGDLHGANFIVDDEGTIWPIDIGCHWNGVRPVVYDDWDE